MGNVIKLSSKTRAEIKMEFETAWEKALCRLFFGASKEKAYSKQSGWNIRLKKCSCETNYATL
ncbi:apolipoprotein N-acyltransferase [Paenibacillus popilliae ATCC 14706]|uniref:Apolipoprotein N-acyltransferase n=1 Tax=Paenibacillus popilliae ATCC 14706 TaxID=1212764 RepID=M9M3H1_PAEPP|nr:apolipoprotein N-acyltransferase [Paenibacillus popilliae ATCC 14706]